jgi:1,5-anhydro-D-fructose reductase (1,5-anhydro-D-mannitol-forming)
MKPFNVGIVGLGGMGQMMLADMLKHDRYSIAVAWDHDKNACQAVQVHYPDLRIASDAHDLISDSAIDLLYVASPPKTHREYFLAAIAAGRHMLCEKPFGVDIAESEYLLKRIETAGLRNVINFNHGNALGSSHIEKQLRNGAIGRVAGVDVFIHLTHWPREFQKTATWLTRREQGGFTREMLSHWLYLTRRLFGDGTIVRAHATFPDDGISSETSLTAELDFGGVPLFIKAATGGVGPIGTEYTLWGSKLSYRLHGSGRIRSSDGGDWVEQFTKIEDIGAADRQRNLDGAAAIFDGAPATMPNAVDGFAVQKLVEDILS